MALRILGIIERERMAFEDTSVTEAYGVGPLQTAPGIVLALSTYDHTLHLVVQGNAAKRFQPFVCAFLRDVLAATRSLMA